MVHDMYKKLDVCHPETAPINPCPVCGSNAFLWSFSEKETDPRQLVVMCENGEVIGPQDGAVNQGCLLYMPPDQFYLGRQADAIKFWNEYAKALSALRRKNNWAAAQILKGTES